LMSCFPDMLFRYFPNDFEMVPFTPIITGMVFYFTFHSRFISTLRSLHVKIFSVYFFIKWISPEIT